MGRPKGSKNKIAPIKPIYSHTPRVKKRTQTETIPMEQDAGKYQIAPVDSEGKQLAEYLPPIRMRLNTIKNTRKSMANILRMAARGEVEMDRARSLAYLLQTLCGAFRVETELSIHDDMEALAKEIKSLKGETNGSK